ncbi:hypothetical protein EBR25_09025 [bacterium]|jgi:hypothetical protein|nr:hypothetical protein [bacterium]
MRGVVIQALFRYAPTVSTVKKNKKLSSAQQRSSRYFFCLASVVTLISLVGCFHQDELISPEPSFPVYTPRGRTLVKGIAACGQCHGSEPSPRSMLTGGRHVDDVYGGVTVPNLTRAEIKDWKPVDVVNAIRRSIRPDGGKLAAQHHLGYEWMADEDAYAVATYIQSLPTINIEHSARELSTLSRYTSGITEERPIVMGFVPSIPRREEAAYGKYLIDNVARCTACHNTPGTTFSEERYLGGGREIIAPDGSSALAPNITNSKTLGIGEWSREEIYRYLISGTPKGTSFRQSTVCPTDFYSSASLEDLRAIAHALTTTDSDS